MAEGFGYADVGNRVKATPDAQYRTVLIGKPMTATADIVLGETTPNPDHFTPKK